jgi:hypothetical protein
MPDVAHQAAAEQPVRSATGYSIDDPAFWTSFLRRLFDAIEQDMNEAGKVVNAGADACGVPTKAVMDRLRTHLFAETPGLH